MAKSRFIVDIELVASKVCVQASLAPASCLHDSSSIGMARTPGTRRHHNQDPSWVEMNPDDMDQLPVGLRCCGAPLPRSPALSLCL